MLKQYFQKITLFTILAFLSFTGLIIIAISRQAEEIKYDIIYKLAIAAVVFAGADILLKQVMKLKKGWLWLLQIFLLLLSLYIWIVT